MALIYVILLVILCWLFSVTMILWHFLDGAGVVPDGNVGGLLGSDVAPIVVAHSSGFRCGSGTEWHRRSGICPCGTAWHTAKWEKWKSRIFGGTHSGTDGMTEFYRSQGFATC